MEETPNPNPNPNPNPAPAGDPWFKGADPDTLGYITNRGLDKLDVKSAALKAIEFHRNAEQKLGAPADRLLRIPNDVSDADGWGKIHTALGKPAKEDGYDFSKVTDADEGFLNFARKFAFTRNMSKADGEALATEFTAFAKANDERDGTEAQAKLQQERSELKKEWGFNEKANLLVAQNAVAKLGIDPAAVAALEGQVGYAGVMKMFQKIGQAIGEDKFVTSETTGQVMTREGAASRIKELKADKEWSARYMAGGTASKEFKEMQDLQRIALTPVQ